MIDADNIAVGEHEAQERSGFGVRIAAVDRNNGHDQGRDPPLRRDRARPACAGADPGRSGSVTRTTRLSLDVADWPAGDRAAWVAARQPALPLDDGGLAAGWSAKTVRQAEKGYGLWLGCLARHGRLDAHAAPGARLTRETLSLFGHELLARVAPQTAASRVGRVARLVEIGGAVPKAWWSGSGGEVKVGG
jgi:hypothetical protein